MVDRPVHDQFMLLLGGDQQMSENEGPVTRQKVFFHLIPSLLREDAGQPPTADLIYSEALQLMVSFSCGWEIHTTLVFNAYSS